MQFNMHDVYNNDGQVKAEMTDCLAGHKQLFALLPNLQLLNQHLHSKTELSIHEEAQSGLYFSFLGTHAINSINDIDSVQVSYQARSISGNLVMQEGEQRSLLQIRITPNHLATLLGESEDHVIQHFTSLKNTLGNNNDFVQLPLTQKSAHICESVLAHHNHSIGLAGHLYALIFTLIEQLQMLNHLSQCEDCQSKLFNAQNLIEASEHQSLNIEHLAQHVGLNTEALIIGFNHIVGQSIEKYWTRNRIKFAAAKLRQNPTEKGNIVAQSGFSEDQFEAAFIQHFGVSSHYYGQVH